jgi:hypothetical protein
MNYEDQLAFAEEANRRYDQHYRPEDITMSNGRVYAGSDYIARLRYAGGEWDYTVRNAWFDRQRGSNE